MAKRWEQITTKCLHHLNDLGLLAAITLIDSSVLAQTSRLQLPLLFLTAFLHRLNKKDLEKDKTKRFIGVLSFRCETLYSLDPHLDNLIISFANVL